MKKLLAKLNIFAAPFVIFLLYSSYQNLAVPVTEYSFRVWEALGVFEKNIFLTGPFYPNFDVTKNEEGDTAHDRAAISKLKYVSWQTDRYGYRKRETGKKPDVVIIGDSFTVGTALDQKDTLSEKIQHKTGLDAYPYAPANINNFISEERFSQDPPKIVILQSIEKLIFGYVGYLKEPEKKSSNIPDFIEANQALSLLAVMHDRLKRGNFTNTLTAKLNSQISNILVEQLRKAKKPVIIKESIVAEEVKTKEQITPEMTKEDVIRLTGLHISRDGTMAFSTQSEEYFVHVSDKSIEELIEKLVEYRVYLASRGIEFIFMPLPNKENIYYKQVRDGSKQDFIHRLIQKAQSNGIRVVDVATAYEESRDTNPKELLYFEDDAHWTPYGVEIAANLLKEEMEKSKAP